MTVWVHQIKLLGYKIIVMFHEISQEFIDYYYSMMQTVVEIITYQPKHQPMNGVIAVSLFSWTLHILKQ